MASKQFPYCPRCRTHNTPDESTGLAYCRQSGCDAIYIEEEKIYVTTSNEITEIFDNVMTSIPNPKEIPREVRKLIVSKATRPHQLAKAMVDNDGNQGLYKQQEDIIADMNKMELGFSAKIKEQDDVIDQLRKQLAEHTVTMKGLPKHLEQPSKLMQERPVCSSLSPLQRMKSIKDMLDLSLSPLRIYKASRFALLFFIILGEIAFVQFIGESFGLVTLVFGTSIILQTLLFVRVYHRKEERRIPSIVFLCILWLGEAIYLSMFLWEMDLFGRNSIVVDLLFAPMVVAGLGSLIANIKACISPRKENCS